ncbi:MAG: hypothetical protein ACK5A0_07035 [Polaromonas sp.]|jgi:hypothetical protein
MKPLAPLSQPKNSVDLLLAQVECFIENIGQALKRADVAGLERHAHDLLGSLTAVKACLSTSGDAGSDPSAKVALKKHLVKMNLQLKQQRELLARKSSLAAQQLDALLPPTPRLTYEMDTERSNERMGSKTFLKA